MTPWTWLAKVLTTEQVTPQTIARAANSIGAKSQSQENLKQSGKRRRSKYDHLWHSNPIKNYYLHRRASKSKLRINGQLLGQIIQFKRQAIFKRSLCVFSNQMKLGDILEFHLELSESLLVLSLLWAFSKTLLITFPISGSHLKGRKFNIAKGNSINRLAKNNTCPNY